ncbi:MAG TPA: nucleotide sugar dehydrogenase [Candidatus Limnocylindrales bacterium]|nr:nucleotide sugar dehydrogenase [Candidatus Limnocylindrales bacterium]
MVETISVIGLGKLGSPLAACVAAAGFKVHAVDLDAKKVEALNRGLPPVHEPGLAETIRDCQGRLHAGQDAEQAVRETDATFIVVGTPSEASGSFSLRYVLPTCEAIGRALRTKSRFHLVILTSTVMPKSTGGEVKTALERFSGKTCGRDFGLCYSPEFIALGTVIRDFYNPDFLLIGESDERSGDMLAGIYRRVCKNSPPVARMNFVNAEITKLAVNTFITTKISFANMIARLCECLPGADANAVTGALGLDSRIGGKYLKGAVSYGGPCFPRDNRAMAALANQAGAFSDLAVATDRFNRAQIKWLAELVKRHHARSGSIGILGLTYKPNTDVIEESVGMLLAQELSSDGSQVVVFDPAVDAGRISSVNSKLLLANSARECVQASEVVVLATSWKEFLDLAEDDWARRGTSRVVIDCWRMLENLEHVDGVRYIRLGFGEALEKRVGSPLSAD